MMFRATPTRLGIGEWRCGVYISREEAVNDLQAMVYGWSEPITIKRAEAVLKALQELEK